MNMLHSFVKKKVYRFTSIHIYAEIYTYNHTQTCAHVYKHMNINI